ncbi:unnamed protein product [Notodromas monacha]|uniref:Uncharacterized protein n=1 Tax=Notodromas monacha TaxID=399045 RepID=A0A7R9BH49_9CRUS|nr:unnamed protein product [Notodromas monacha]CAG0914325.1 unnamed protein product [Notodromas monacha]
MVHFKLGSLRLFGRRRVSSKNREISRSRASTRDQGFPDDPNPRTSDTAGSFGPIVFGAEETPRLRVIRAVHYLSCFRCNKAYQFAHELEQEADCFICKGSVDRSTDASSSLPQLLATKSDVWATNICKCSKEFARVHTPMTTQGGGIPIIWDITEENVEHMNGPTEINNNISIRTDDRDDAEALEVDCEMESIHRPALTTEGCQTDAVQIVPANCPIEDNKQIALQRRRRELERALAVIDRRLEFSRGHSPYRGSSPFTESRTPTIASSSVAGGNDTQFQEVGAGNIEDVHPALMTAVAAAAAGDGAGAQLSGLGQADKAVITVRGLVPSCASLEQRNSRHDRTALA